MDMIRELEPHLRADAGARLSWGLYCPRERRWLDASFATEQAAREAIPIIASSSSR